MISIVAFCVFGMVAFKSFFLLAIKILYFPVEVLIPFQSPPSRTHYQVDVTPYITHGLLLMQNRLVSIPNFDSFSTFYYLTSFKHCIFSSVKARMV